MMLVLTESNFDEVVHSTESLLIEFSASWCGPCKAYEQVLAECEKAFPNFTFAKIDIEDQSGLAEEFQVRSVPATMILRNSVVICMEAGALTQSVLTELLEQASQLDVSQLPR